MPESLRNLDVKGDWGTSIDFGRIPSAPHSRLSTTEPSQELKGDWFHARLPAFERFMNVGAAPSVSLWRHHSKGVKETMGRFVQEGGVTARGLAEASRLAILLACASARQ